MNERSIIEKLLLGLALAAVTVFLIVIGSGAAFRTYRMPTGAMAPTIVPGERVIAVRLTRPPVRHEIITFRFPLQPTTTFAKRIVAMPGETLEIRDKRVFINGKALAEPYAVHEDPQIYPATTPPLPEPYASRDQFGPFVVPAGSYFVMGDNRDRSSDSRYWGTVPAGEILGRIVAAYSWRSFRRTTLR